MKVVAEYGDFGDGTPKYRIVAWEEDTCSDGDYHLRYTIERKLLHNGEEVWVWYGSDDHNQDFFPLVKALYIGKIELVKK